MGAQITKIFYPDSITDDYDNTVKDINETEFKSKVKDGSMVKKNKVIAEIKAKTKIRLLEILMKRKLERWLQL